MRILLSAHGDVDQAAGNVAVTFSNKFIRRHCLFSFLSSGVGAAESRRRTDMLLARVISTDDHDDKRKDIRKHFQEKSVIRMHKKRIADRIAEERRGDFQVQDETRENPEEICAECPANRIPLGFDLNRLYLGREDRAKWTWKTERILIPVLAIRWLFTFRCPWRPRPRRGF